MMKFMIKRIREEKNISQEELARLSGVSRTTISGLETGKITVVGTDTLEKLAKALGVKVKAIFFENDV